jgi:hypothetical protein
MTSDDEDDVPDFVDLHYTRIVEWLQKNGFARIQTTDDHLKLKCKYIQQKLNASADAVQSHFKERALDIPSSIRELLELKLELTYFDALLLLHELEKQQGRSARNIFGFFNSVPLKAVWQLLRSWEVDNIHIYMGTEILCRKLGYKDARLEVDLHNIEKQLKAVECR